VSLAYSLVLSFDQSIAPADPDPPPPCCCLARVPINQLRPEKQVKLFLKKGDKKSQKFDMQIGNLIDFPLLQFEKNDIDGEVAAFRRSVKSVCQDAIKRRRAGGEKAAFTYMYPPATEDPKSQLPSHLTALLADGSTGEKEIRAKVSVPSVASSFTTTVMVRQHRDCTVIAP